MENMLEQSPKASQLLLSEELISQWVEQMDVSKDSKRTLAANIKAFTNWAGERAKDPDRQTILDFRQYLIEDKKLKPNTVKNYISTLRLLFAWMEKKSRKEGYVPFQSPAEDIKTPKLPKGHARQPLSVWQIQQILELYEGKRDELSLRNKAMIALLACTGLRANSLRTVRIQDLKSVNGQMVLYYLGKGRIDYDQYVKIPKQLAVLIKEYLQERFGDQPLDPNDWLFVSKAPNRKPNQLTQHAISLVVKNAMKSVGLDDSRYTCHSLRHSAATNNVILGGSLESTMALLGHANIAQTMTYIHDLERIQNNSEQRIADAVLGKIE